jgi:hypothetical protein
MTRPYPHRITKFRAWADDKMHAVRALSFTEQGVLYRFMDADGAERWPKHLMSFTGFRDKFGREIYDSDIVVWAGIGGAETGRIIWDGVMGMYQFESPHGGNYGFGYFEAVERMKVIGNVYETPHLIAKH